MPTEIALPKRLQSRVARLVSQLERERAAAEATDRELTAYLAGYLASRGVAEERIAGVNVNRGVIVLKEAEAIANTADALAGTSK